MGDEGEAFEGERYTVRRVEGGEGRVGTAANRAVKGLNGSQATFPY